MRSLRRIYIMKLISPDRMPAESVPSGENYAIVSDKVIILSVLMPDYSVFVVKAVVRAGVVRSLQKAVHLVLVEIH